MGLFCNSKLQPYSFKTSEPQIFLLIFLLYMYIVYAFISIPVRVLLSISQRLNLRSLLCLPVPSSIYCWKSQDYHFTAIYTSLLTSVYSCTSYTVKYILTMCWLRIRSVWVNRIWIHKQTPVNILFSIYKYCLKYSSGKVFFNFNFKSHQMLNQVRNGIIIWFAQNYNQEYPSSISESGSEFLEKCYRVSKNSC